MDPRIYFIPIGIGFVIFALALYGYDAWITKKELEGAEKHGKTTEENIQM